MADKTLMRDERRYTQYVYACVQQCSLIRINKSSHKEHGCWRSLYIFRVRYLFFFSF